MAKTTSPIHRAAADGFAAATDSYERGRPGYPREIVDWLRDRLDLRAGRRVLELGAGTGKFTPRLIETGARVIAVEPVPQMRAALSARLPDLETLAGTAEAIPLRDASVDAIVCAQSFHWFATAAALTEIQRVLTPGGRLGLVWNTRDERVAWVARLGQIVNRLEGDAPRHSTGAWRAVFPFPGFGPLHEQQFSHVHTGAAEDVIVDRVKSTSFIAAMAPDERSTIVAEIRALIATEPALAGKDIVTVPYRTEAFYTVMTGKLYSSKTPNP